MGDSLSPSDEENREVLLIIRKAYQKFKKISPKMKRILLQGLKELMEVYNEFMLADKGHHSLKAWKGEVIDQAIEVRESNRETPGSFVVLPISIGGCLN
jgi:hypothetical protein